MFGNLVIDPQAFHPNLNQSPYSLCVPLSIALTLLVRIENYAPSSLTKKMIKTALSLFCFNPVLNPTEGIRLSNFHKLEKLNTPFSINQINQYPSLAQFHGLALNVFFAKIQQSPLASPKRTPIQKSKTPSLFLFPKYLSVNHGNADYLQVDMLISDPSFYFETDDQPQLTTKRFHLQQHVLVISNLPLLVARRNATTRTHSKRFTELCRRCLNLYQSSLELREHKNQCHAYPSGRAMQPRRCRNQVLYRPYVYNKYTRKVEKNYLKFKPGHLYRTLKPLFATFIDFENLRTDIVPDQSTKADYPMNAHSESTPFAFSIVHTSNYNEIATPQYLKAPRTFFYNPETQSEDTFHLKLLTVLREDLLLLERFLGETLEKDIGPPSYKNIPTEIRNEFLSSTNCPICGRRYNSFCLSHGKKKKVKRTRHHCHYLSFLNNVQSICNFCNLQVQSEIAKRTCITISAHFGAKFDALIMALGLFFLFPYSGQKTQ